MGLWALALVAQLGCQTVTLPDLAPPDGVQTATINTSVDLPSTIGGDGFYPFDLFFRSGGIVEVAQKVGHPSKRSRVWTKVVSVSLVNWFTAINGWMWDGRFWVWGTDNKPHVYDDREERVQFVGYKTLPFGEVFPLEPTWAFRIFPEVTARRANMALSMPLQAGEIWNVGLINLLYDDDDGHPYGITVKLQIEVRICTSEFLKGD